MDKVGSITELYRGDLGKSKISAETGRYTSQLEPPVFDELQNRKILALGVLGFANAEQNIRLLALDCNLPANSIFTLSDPKFGSVFELSSDNQTRFMVGWGVPFIKSIRGRSIAAEYIVGITDENIFGTTVIDTAADPKVTARRRYISLNGDATVNLERSNMLRTHHLSPILLNSTINPDQKNLDEFRKAVTEVIASDANNLKKLQTGHALTMPEQLDKIVA